MQRQSSKMQFAVLAIVVVAFLHMAAVTVAALPTNQVSTTAAPATSYLSPYFTQNWRLFAPNPISSDRTFWVQGEYVGDDGQKRHTRWFNWSDVELDLIEHHLVGGRAGYITNKLLGPLGDVFSGLSDKQREIAAKDGSAAETDYAQFRAELLAASRRPQSVARYLRYEYAAVRLSTAVLSALHPTVDLTAVRYRIGRQPVVPYAMRTLPRDHQNRPDASYRAGGWRMPIPPSTLEQQVFDDFLRRHR